MFRGRPFDLLFLRPRFVYEANRGQVQNWTPSFQTISELVVSRI